jgi:serine/threonine protein kinase
LRAPEMDQDGDKPSPLDAATITSGEDETLRASATEISESSTEISDTPAEEPSFAGEPQLGDLISNRYRLEKVLGEGGMGKVFKAVDELYAGEFKDKQSEVALKFLGKRFSAHKASRMALQRETRKSQQLAHPNVVRVMHFDQHEGSPYMIMEFMRGQPLDEFIRSEAPQGMPLPKAMQLIRGMADGLDYIHASGLVHSDFKPNNVFVGEDGCAKVLDLGIARINESQAEEQPQTVFDASALGALTPTYASCEMFEQQTPHPKDDIYAYALVIYELLTGVHPFNRVSAIKARAEEIQPERIDTLRRGQWKALQSGLAFNREDRIGTAGDLVEGLRGKKSRRRLINWLLIATASIAVLGAAVVALFYSTPEGPEARFASELRSLSADAGQLTSSNEMRVQRWLEQGNAYLDIAEAEYLRGDLLSAHYILLDGADNARSAYMSALKLSPSEDAIGGITRLVGLYSQWTGEKLQQGDAKTAAWTACQGLAVFPEHPDLMKNYVAATNRLPGTEPKDCGTITSSEP